MEPARDVIAIHGLETECVVGVYPHERGTPQPLCIDVELSVDTEAAARSEKLSYSIDYDGLASQLVFLLQSCRFRLLETAAHALCAYLLSPPAPGERRAQVRAVRLKLTKPDALGGRAVPSLTVERKAGLVEVAQKQAPFGTVDVINETREAGIYRLNLAAGRQAPLSVRPRAVGAAMALSDGLSCDGEQLTVGSVCRTTDGERHTYENPTPRQRTILLVHCPEPARFDWESKPRPRAHGL